MEPGDAHFLDRDHEVFEVESGCAERKKQTQKLSTGNGLIEKETLPTPTRENPKEESSADTEQIAKLFEKIKEFMVRQEEPANSAGKCFEEESKGKAANHQAKKGSYDLKRILAGVLTLFAVGGKGMEAPETPSTIKHGGSEVAETEHGRLFSREKQKSAPLRSPSGQERAVSGRELDLETACYDTVVTGILASEKRMKRNPDTLAVLFEHEKEVREIVSRACLLFGKNPEWGIDPDVFFKKLVRMEWFEEATIPEILFLVKNVFFSGKEEIKRIVEPGFCVLADGEHSFRALEGCLD
ncbi:MAG: uncharacterized protein A8A55_2261 [Amphiamblys sp. WSBS2006]|nr:MAG: uncharacterized protein A8A55_2261 [Amphiamblys sp. WSBS2006]